MKVRRHLSSLVIASILFMFSATSYAGGFISSHAGAVNLSVGFNHFGGYGHRANRNYYGHRYQPRRFVKQRNFNRRYNRSYNRGFDRGFNRGFRSGYSRNYCPTRY